MRRILATIAAITLTASPAVSQDALQNLINAFPGTNGQGRITGAIMQSLFQAAHDATSANKAAISALGAPAGIVGALGFTPPNLAGPNSFPQPQSFNGGLLLKPAGATTTVDLGARQAALGFLSTDFGAKCDGLLPDGSVNPNPTDDHDAIQAVMNAGAALSVQVELVPRGKACVIGSQIYVSSNSHIRIDGTLKLKNGANAQMIINKYLLSHNGTPTTATDVGDDNIVIEGDGKLDANGSNQPNPNNSNLSNIFIYGPTTNLTISGVTLLNNTIGSPLNIVGGSNIRGVGAKHVHLSYVTVIGSPYSNQFATGCDDCTADHMTLIDPPANGDYPWSMYGNITNAALTNSTIIGGIGVSILQDGACGSPTALPSSNIKIEGNTISGGSLSAVNVLNNTTPVSGCGVAQHSHIVVANNEGFNNNLGNFANYGGLTVQNTDDLRSSANSWHDDGPSSTPANPTSTAGEYFDANSSHIVSDGDSVSNEGRGGTTGVGFALGAGATFVTINHPHIFDTQPAPTLKVGFTGQAPLGSGLIISRPSISRVATVSTLTYGADATIDIPNFVSQMPGPFNVTGVITSTGRAMPTSVVPTAQFTSEQALDGRGAGVVGIATGASAPLVGNSSLGSTVQGGSFTVTDTATGNTALYVGDAASGFVLIGGNAEWVAPTTTPAAGKSSLNTDGNTLRVYNATGATRTYRVVSMVTR